MKGASESFCHGVSAMCAYLLMDASWALRLLSSFITGRLVSISHCGRRNLMGLPRSPLSLLSNARAYVVQPGPNLPITIS
jgi:hypothetical protein